MTRSRIAPSRYRSRRKARRRVRLVATLVVAMSMALGAAAVLRGKTPATQTVAGTRTDASTPRDKWRAGEVPYLYQTDPQWADHPYAGGTVRENGCGPTCLSMAYIALSGKSDLDPAAMAGFSEAQGYTTRGMTAWALMTEGAAELGLASEELPADEGTVAAALRSGKAIICSVRPGDFTTTGHFIVLAGMDDNGGVIVRDPNSAERSARTWDLERVLEQCANLWALSAA